MQTNSLSSNRRVQGRLRNSGRAGLPLSFVLALGLFLGSRSASAQAPAPAAGPTDPWTQGKAPSTVGANPTEDEVNRLVDEETRLGAAAQKAMHWEEARAHYEKALKLRNNKNFYLAANLGVVEHQMGLWSRAAEHLSIVMLSAPPPNLRTKYSKWLEDAKKKVATVTLTTVPTGVTLFLDDQELGTTPREVPLFLDPGKHVIRGSLNGHSEERVYEASAGATDAIELNFPAQQNLALTGPGGAVGIASANPTAANTSSDPKGPLSSPPDTAPYPHQESARNTARTAVLITEGVLTGAALIAGIAFRVRGAGLKQDVDKLGKSIPVDGCNGPAPSSDCQLMHEKRGQSDTANRLTVGFTVTGAVLAAATVGTWLIWKPNKQENVVVRAVPTAGVGFVGVGVLGRF